MQTSGADTTMPVRDNRSDPNSSGVAGSPLNLALVAVVAWGVIVGVVGLVGWGMEALVGIAVGTLVSAANLLVFRMIGRGLASEDGSSRPLWALFGVAKFVGLLVGVGLLLYLKVVGVIPFAVGYGGLPVGLTLAVLLTAQLADEPMVNGMTPGSNGTSEPNPAQTQ